MATINMPDAVKFKFGFGGPDGPMPNVPVIQIRNKETDEFVMQFYLDDEDCFAMAEFVLGELACLK